MDRVKPPAENPQYVRQPNGDYHCRDCQSIIMAVPVHHPIWDGPFDCSGSGQVEIIDTPYCPKCETPPSMSGTPIRVPFPGIIS